MKKLSLTLAAAILFGSISFAQTTPAPAKDPVKKEVKKDDKKKDHKKKDGKGTGHKKTTATK